MATWADGQAKAGEMLGIQLADLDVLNVPLLATDPYGHFLRGPNVLPALLPPGSQPADATQAPVTAHRPARRERSSRASRRTRWCWTTPEDPGTGSSTTSRDAAVPHTRPAPTTRCCWAALRGR